MIYTNMNIGLQCILLFFACSTVCSRGTRVITRLDRLEICDQSAASPLTVNYVHLSNPPNENVRISMSATLDNYTGSIDLEVIMQRCLSREALDTCIPFATLKPLNTCSFLMMKNMTWTKLIESMDQFTCPVTKRAEVVVNDASLDMNLFSVFPIDMYYWKPTATLYFGKEYITFCIEAKLMKFHN